MSQQLVFVVLQFLCLVQICDSSLFGLCYAAICIWPLVLCFGLGINLFEGVLQGAKLYHCICERKLIWI